MKVYFMKQKALDSLQKDAPENLHNYESESSWIDQYFIDKDAPNYCFDTGIEVDDYQLIKGGPENDFKNAKILFEVFKGKLNPLQASDLRLWAYLAHAQHWDYMYSRWKIDAPDDEDDEDERDEGKKSPKDKAVSRIQTRYFFGASRGKAFVRQGIARLYWGAYLTYDEDNERGNPYELTEYFFNKQDVFTSITERSYARNKTFVLAALRELKKHPELSREEIRLYLAKLNQAGAITVLDFLSKEQAGAMCASIMDDISRVPVLKDGSIFKAYNNLTGKAFGVPLKIVGGKCTALGKSIKTKPQILSGKKEGSKIVIAGQTYVIKDFQ